MLPGKTKLPDAAIRLRQTTTCKRRAGLGLSGLLASPGLKRPAASAARIVAGIVGFFLILEFITRLELVPPVYLPRASTVLLRMAELLQDPNSCGMSERRSMPGPSGLHLPR